MPINKSQQTVPRQFANSPSTSSRFMEPVAAQWFNEYLDSEHASRSRAIPELPLRASSVGTRCDRALWYDLAGFEETNPPDAAATFRMRLGQLVHDAFDNAIKALPTFGQLDDQQRKHGWFTEEAVDLSPIGFPGSAHGDLVRYEHGVAQEVLELKSASGYPFKVAVTTFGGGPQGPRLEHILQAALVAVALKAPKITVGWVSLEPISPDLATRMNLTELGRFVAEWTYDTAEYEELVAQEAARQVRLLRMVEANLRPERSLSMLEGPAGAVISDIESSKWQVVSPVDGRITAAGKTWFCGYCRYKDQCDNDGSEMAEVPVEVR